MDKLLLTGSQGFLGSELLQRLRKKFVVTTLSKTLCKEADLKDSHLAIDLSMNISEILPFSDIVVHCAGKAHSIPKSESECKSFFDVNLEGTKNLCIAMLKANALPKAFIFISTVAVYGLDSGYKINENYPLLGDTPYAKSKILAEKWLIEWAEKNHVKLSILRLPLIAGHNPPGNLGKMIKGIRTGKYFSIGKANARKSIVWAEDIARIIPTLSNIGGIYNLTDGYHPSFRELEDVISRKLNKKAPVSLPLFFAIALGRIGDIMGTRSPFNMDKLKKITSTLTFDDQKAKYTLGWNPSPVLQRLSETLKNV